MANLSDKLSSLQFTPKPQSPAFAGAVVNVPLAQVSKYQEKNYFLCDGSEYSETTYDQLFAACGTQYNTGGETAGFFRVPNGPRKTNTLTPSFSSTPSGWSTTSRSAYYEQDSLGIWWAVIHFAGTCSVLTADGQTITVDGVTFTGTNIGASIEGSPGQDTMAVTASGSILTLKAVSGQQMNGWSGSVRAELASKPTDAAVSADSRFSTFDEALQFQPMIKVYDDASNISMSLADATATKTGAIRLDSSFAAGDGVYGVVQADRTQKKILSGTVSSNGVIADLTYDQLVVGKRYQILAMFDASYSSSGDSIEVEAFENSIRVGGAITRYDSSSGTHIETLPLTTKFTAGSGTLTFEATFVGGSANLRTSNTQVVLTELNNDIETTDLSS
jgi:hypothetical protein